MCRVEPAQIEVAEFTEKVIITPICNHDPTGGSKNSPHFNQNRFWLPQKVKRIAANNQIKT
jgi:hypothetical protein